MPIHLKCKPHDIADWCLLPGDPGRAEMIARTYLTKAVEVNSHRGLAAYTGAWCGLRVSVVTTGMGCPSAAIVVEELARLNPKTTLIRIGTCGGVQKHVKPGDLVLPEAAIPLTGIMKSYGLELVPPVPDAGVLGALIKEAQTSRTRYHTGLICTSDAFYQEKSEAGTWEGKNALACEMECAGIFAIARLRGLRSGAILTATGSILYGRQVMETPLIKRAIKSMIEVSLAAIKNLNGGVAQLVRAAAS